MTTCPATCRHAVAFAEEFWHNVRQVDTYHVATQNAVASKRLLDCHPQPRR